MPFTRRCEYLLYVSQVCYNVHFFRICSGFIEEGRMRKCNWIGGRWDDIILMSILQDEWGIDCGKRKDAA